MAGQLDLSGNRKVFGLSRSRSGFQPLGSCFRNTSPSEDSPHIKAYKNCVLHLDTNIWSKLYKTNSTLSLHPQDTCLKAVWETNITHRTILLKKLFTCKYAIPIIVPHEDNMHVAEFGIGSVIVTRKGPPITEENAMKSEVKIVSCLRLTGDEKDHYVLSKSATLNGLLYGLNNRHHTFYNRYLPGGDRKREFATGSVEAAWYMPTTEIPDETWNSEVMLLNLRGPAVNHKPQVKLLGSTSHVVVIFMDVTELAETAFKDIHDIINSGETNIVLALMPSKRPCPLDSIISRCREAFGGSDPPNCTFCKLYTGGNSDKPQNEATIIDDLKCSVGASLTGKGGGASPNKGGTSWSEIVKALKHNRDILTENDDPEFKALVQNLEHQTDEDLIPEPLLPKLKGIIEKDEVLPLQSKWKEWISLYKKHEKLVLDGDTKECFPIKKEMNELRGNQFDILFKETYETSIMGAMLPLLTELAEENLSEKLLFFLSSVAQWIRTKSKIKMLKSTREYLENYEELRRARIKDRNTQPNLHQRRQTMEQTVSAASFDIFHIFREISQIYEASSFMDFKSTRSKKIPEIFLNYKMFPDLMSKVLMAGHPIELLDADAGSMQIEWMKAVFKSLIQYLGEKKILVISALGVQSSGKSTLLNTMFGIDFPVGAGKCTRGVYGQLVQAETGRFGRQATFDYLLILDSEGMRALDGCPDQYRRDNEIATMIIGLSDLTIITIKGEHSADMEDIIPIAVHAFFRMHMLNIRRRCIFVHQNVPSITSTSQSFIKTRRSFIENSLNEATKDIAIIENVFGFENFKQIVDCDLETDTIYFSGIWNGEPPMAPADPNYSRTAQEVLEKHIYNKYVDDSNVPMNCSALLTQLERVWTGIATESWLFDFRRSRDLKEYVDLRIFILECRVNLYKFVEVDCFSKVTNSLQGAANIEVEEPIIYREMNQLLEDKIKESRDKLTARVIKNPALFRRSDIRDIKQFQEDLGLTLKSITQSVSRRVQIKRSVVDMNLNEDELKWVESLRLKENKKKDSSSEVGDAALEPEFNKLWNNRKMEAREIIKQKIQDVLKCFHVINLRDVKAEIKANPIGLSKPEWANHELHVKHMFRNSHLQEEGKFWKRTTFDSGRTEPLVIHPDVQVKHLNTLYLALKTFIDGACPKHGEIVHLETMVFKIVSEVAIETDKIYKAESDGNVYQYKFTAEAERKLAVGILNYAYPKLMAISEKYDPDLYLESEYKKFMLYQARTSIKTLNK